MSGNTFLNKTINSEQHTLSQLFQETQENIEIKFITNKTLWFETTEYCYFIHLNEQENICFSIIPSNEKHIFADVQQKTIQCKNVEQANFQYLKISKNPTIQQICTPIYSQFAKDNISNQQYNLNCVYSENSIAFQNQEESIVQIEKFKKLINTEYFSILKEGQSLPQIFEIQENNFKLSKKYSNNCTYFQALSNQSIENIININSTEQQSKQYKYSDVDIQTFINPIFTQTFHPDTNVPLFYKSEISKEIDSAYIDNYDIDFLNKDGLVLNYFNGKPVEKTLFFYTVSIEPNGEKTKITYKIYTNLISQYISCIQNFISTSISTSLKLEPIQFQSINSSNNAFEIPEQLQQLQYVKEFDFINSISIIGVKSIAEKNQFVVQRHKKDNLIVNTSGLKQVFSFKTKAIKQTNNPIYNVYKQNVIGQVECKINNETINVQKHNGMFVYKSNEDMLEVTYTVDLRTYNQGLVSQNIDLNGQVLQFDGFDLRLLLNNNRTSSVDVTSNEIIPILKKECKSDTIIYNAEQDINYTQLEITAQKKLEINIQKPVDETYTVDTTNWNITNNLDYSYGFDFITQSDENKCMLIKHNNDLNSGELIKLYKNYMYIYNNKTEDIFVNEPLTKIFKISKNKWYSLYIVKKDNILKIFLNGQKIFQCKQSISQRKNQNIIINEHLTPDPTNSNFFEGNIRNFQIFNRQLQNNEVLSIYKKTFNLLAADVLYKFESSCESETSNKVEVIYNSPVYKTINIQYDNQFFDTDMNVYHQLTKENGQIITKTEQPYSETFYINNQLNLSSDNTNQIYTVNVTYPASSDYAFYINERI